MQHNAMACKTEDATRHDRPVTPDSAASSDRYAPVLQAIHWLITVLVIAQFTFILCNSRLQAFEFANTVLAWHRVCGLILLVLIIARVAVRFWAPAPRLWRMPRLQACAAHSVHAAMLAVPVALAVIGIVMTAARGDTLSFFGLFDFPAVIDYNRTCPISFSSFTAGSRRLSARWL